MLALYIIKRRGRDEIKFKVNIKAIKLPRVNQRNDARYEVCVTWVLSVRARISGKLIPRPKVVTEIT